MGTGLLCDKTAVHSDVIEGSFCCKADYVYNKYVMFWVQSDHIFITDLKSHVKSVILVVSFTIRNRLIFGVIRITYISVVITECCLMLRITLL